MGLNPVGLQLLTIKCSSFKERESWLTVTRRLTHVDAAVPGHGEHPRLGDGASKARSDGCSRSDRNSFQSECSGRRCGRGAYFRSRSLQLLPYRRTNKCVASDRRHRPELSRHCKHQGYDGDGSAGFPHDFTSKYAKPDPHARSDSGCDRLYPELTRRPLTRQRGYLPFEEAPRGHVTDDAVGFGIRGSLDNGHECTIAERHAARQYLSFGLQPNHVFEMGITVCSSDCEKWLSIPYHSGSGARAHHGLEIG